MELRLPAPCLVVLVGASGSGKTTWANTHFAINEVVSSDALRAMAGIGEDDQQASTVAFELLDRIASARLSRGLTTVVDTTGLDRDPRREWVRRAHAAGLPAYAVLFDTPPGTCEQRNATKPRPIPKTVLRKQLSRFRQVAEHIGEDGFDGVHPVQPVAAVTPLLAEVTASTGSRESAARHTFGLSMSRFDWPKKDLAEQLVTVARRAETAGFRDIWLMDHFRQIPQVGRSWEDLPEAYTTLSYLAGKTQRIRLGVLVTGITHRNPVLLGKMIATLDVLSGGRAICGLGIGWDHKEHLSYGIDFPTVSERYSVLEDTLEMLPLLWGKGSPSFEGRTFSATELVCYPRPIQDHIPIMIGGAGEKRTLKLVAEHGDACNVFGTPTVVRSKVEVLASHCADFGRDPGDIEVSHLVPALVATNRPTLTQRIDAIRGRNTSREAYAARHNAGTADDLVDLFAAYSAAGAQHSIVAIPDAAHDGSLEAFGEVIAAFDGP